MNKQLLLTMLAVLCVLFSVSAVCASEVNVTDSYATSLVDDTSDVSVYNYTAGSGLSVSSNSNVGIDSSKVSLSSEQVLGSEDSNTLSTNKDSDKWISNDQIVALTNPVTSSSDVNVVDDGVASNVDGTSVEVTDNDYVLEATAKKDVYFVASNKTVRVDKISGGYSYYVVLKSIDGKALANEKITLTFNGKKKTATTDSKGKAYFNISIARTNTYPISLAFAGDSNYNALTCTNFATIKVEGIDVYFVAPNRTLYLDEISGGYVYSVILKDIIGHKLADKKVTMIFNGETYTATTDSTGRAYFTISVKKTGNYKVTLKFASDRYYNSLSAYSIATVKVTGVDVYFVAPDRTVNIDEISKGYVYPIVLKDANGHNLANEKVTLVFNGEKYVETTDSTGWAYFNIKVDKTGKYKVTLKFAGDGYYNSKSSYSITTVKVTGIDVTFVAPDRTVDLDDISGGYSYPVMLKDVDGHNLANKEVTITFNGQKQTGITDSKGKVNFDITASKAGKYGVSLAFSSDGYYNSLSCPNFKTVTVVNGQSVVFVAEDKNVPYNEIYFGYLYPVLITDAYGKALPNKKITLTFNGKTQTATTDNTGYCYFTLTSDVMNTYTVTLKFAGDQDYDAASCKKTITVTETTNPYGNKAKKAWINADSGSDDMKWDVAYQLVDLGWEVYVDGTGPGYHYPGYYDVTSDYQVYITLYNGFCAGTIREAYYDYIQNELNSKGVQLVIMWETRTWTDPQGMYPYRYGDFDGYKAGRAWDDDFSPDDPTIEDVGDWLMLKNAVYCAGTSAYDLVDQFSAGGYFKYTGVSIDDVLAGAEILKSYYDKNKAFPDSVTVSGYTYTTSQFLFMMSQAVYKLGNSNKNPVNYIISGIIDASSPMGDNINAKLLKADYLTVAKNVLEYIRFNRQVPTYASSAVGKLNCTTLVDAFSRILVYYKNNNALPSNVAIVQTKSNDESSSGIVISINNILNGANSLKSYYEKNKAFPNSISVGGIEFTMQEFLYVMSQAIYQIGSSNVKPIECIADVKAASSSSGDAVNAQLLKADYLTVAKNVADFIQFDSQVPNYASSAVGKLNYTTLVDAFSRILAFYRNNEETLPNYVTIKQSSSGGSSDKPTSVSINDVLTGANNLKKYYDKNGALPNTITVLGYAFTAPEFLYLMDQAIYQLGQSNTTPINCIYGIKAASSSTGDNMDAQLLKADYLTVAKNVADYIKSNNQAPNFASSKVGKLSYYTLIDASSRILAYYKNNGNEFPSYVTIKQSSADFKPGGGNVINTITDLTPYYQSTKNCQVNNSQIKALVNSLTSGLTTAKDKAIAIYNYVRDKISYSFYYDTRYGAVGTLDAKTGNCVDQAHLLVAMYRTAGLAARYEHGTCYFPLSGNTYGHVWTQVLIDDLWVVGDPTSERNALGTVNNWNTNSYTHNGYYASLPF